LGFGGIWLEFFGFGGVCGLSFSDLDGNQLFSDQQGCIFCGHFTQL